MTDGPGRLTERVRGADRARWTWWLGLAALVAMVGGSGWYQAWTTAPYRAIDEQAHVGYVLELLDGRLPTIDTPIDAADGGLALRLRIDREPAQRRTVWVANNPPLPYAVAAPASWVTRQLDLPGGPLLGLRLVNLASMAVSVVFVARLARTLAGGDQRIALVAGGFYAASPHLGFVAGLAFTDGPALLASFAMLDALASWCRRAPTRGAIAWLAAWCAVGAAVRPMTAVLAGAVMTMALAVSLVRRPGWRRVVQTALVLGVPTLLTSAWWYLRNVRLYGDPTGSDRLLEKFARTPRRGPWHIFGADDVWREIQRTWVFRRLAKEDIDYQEFWPLYRWVLIAVLLTALAVVVRDQFPTRPLGRAPVARTPALSWLASVGGAVVIIGLTAQHWSGGGSPHPRYAFPVFALVCTAVALVIVRFGHRALGLVLISGQLVLHVRQTQLATRFLNANPSLPVRPELFDPIGPAWWRLAGGAVVLLGFVALVVAVVQTPVPAAEEAEVGGSLVAVPPT